ncbi:hypothetical protein EVAR_68929_1 [Eumeta japonica]|uniref:Uncharacterized protein n=1 Tax=Eumeta variegata TaxID=151549 RepID=A0A4C2A7M4_EUMVA|nr:hypothetical protein EVAR_68929_1 [Eumeta japonica]
MRLDLAPALDHDAGSCLIFTLPLAIADEAVDIKINRVVRQTRGDSPLVSRWSSPLMSTHSSREVISALPAFGRNRISNRGDQVDGRRRGEATGNFTHYTKGDSGHAI